MMTANAHANADAFLSYAGMASRPELDEELFGFGPCDRLYRSNDGWLVLTVTTDAEWERFCATSGRLDLLTDGRFADATARAKHAGELADVLEAMFSTRSAAEWEAVLAGAGVACVRADEWTVGEFAANSEQMRVNGFVPETHHARFGAMRRWGPVVQVDGGAATYGPGVLGGANTDALLTEVGYSASEIAALRSARAVASEATDEYIG